VALLRRQPVQAAALTHLDAESRVRSFAAGTRKRLMVDQRDDLTGCWISPRFVLGKSTLAVDRDVEYSAVTLDQLGDEASLLLDFGRQTGSPRQVVSTPAVCDLDLHKGPPVSYGGSTHEPRASPTRGWPRR